MFMFLVPCGLSTPLSVLPFFSVSHFHVHSYFENAFYQKVCCPSIHLLQKKSVYQKISEEISVYPSRVYVYTSIRMLCLFLFLHNCGILSILNIVFYLIYPGDCFILRQKQIYLILFKDLIVFPYIDRYFNQSPIDKHLGCFQSFVAINNGAVNILVHKHI